MQKDINQYGQKAEEDINQRHQQAGLDIWQCHQHAEGGICQHNQQAGGGIYQNDQQAGEDIWQTDQKAPNGTIYMAHTKVKDQEVTAWIREHSRICYEAGETLDVCYIVRAAMEKPGFTQPKKNKRESKMEFITDENGNKMLDISSEEDIISAFAVICEEKEKAQNALSKIDHLKDWVWAELWKRALDSGLDGTFFDQRLSYDDESKTIKERTSKLEEHMESFEKMFKQVLG